MTDKTGAGDYYNFMGFSDDKLKERYWIYAEMLRGCSRVVDLGCGTGVFLELLKERGVNALGVDPDPGQVKRCIEKGLSAELSDASNFLAANPRAFDGIFCAHVIEHMGGQEVAGLASSCYEAMKDGGLALWVTPNPESLHMHLREFWRDPTHIRMYSKEAVGFLLTNAGFGVEDASDNRLYSTGRESVEDSLRTDSWWTRIVAKQVLKRLHLVLPPFGLDQGNEVFVLARRPKGSHRQENGQSA